MAEPEEDEEKSVLEEETDELYNALAKAQKAFEKHFEDGEWDGAYFQLELKGYVLDSDFKKLKMIEIRDVWDTEKNKEEGK